MFPNADDVDIVSGSQFHGLRTYANLPYINCLSDAEANENKYDIAILGAPFDTVCRGDGRNKPRRQKGPWADPGG